MSASTSRPKVNLRSTAVKRIMQETSELADVDIAQVDFVAAPLENDIFEWHCTIRGVAGSEYDGGIYHLRIILPTTYPMSPPDIIFLTPNGRFELGKKICIDGITSFHTGSWQPAWGIRTALLGLRSFWMQNGEALSAVGALDCSKDERKRLAGLSRKWKCSTCGACNDSILPDKPVDAVSSSSSQPVKSDTANTFNSPAILSDANTNLRNAPISDPPTIAPLFQPIESSTRPSRLSRRSSSSSPASRSRDASTSIAQPPSPLVDHTHAHAHGHDYTTVHAHAHAHAHGQPVPAPQHGPIPFMHRTPFMPPFAQQIITERLHPRDNGPPLRPQGAPGLQGTQGTQVVPVETRATVRNRAGDTRPPFWLDAAIALAVGALLIMLTRRLASSGSVWAGAGAGAGEVGDGVQDGWGMDL